MQNQEQAILVIADSLSLAQKVLGDLVGTREAMNTDLLQDLASLDCLARVLPSYLQIQNKYFSTRIRLALVQPMDSEALRSFVKESYLDVQLVLFLQETAQEKGQAKVLELLVPQGQAVVVLDGQEGQMDSADEAIEVVGYQLGDKGDGGLLGGDSGQQRLMDLIECTSWVNIPVVKESRTKEEPIEQLETPPKRIQKEEDEMEEFTQMMGEMSNLRASCQGLSDEERRKRASDMIMRLSQMMGEEEDM